MHSYFKRLARGVQFSVRDQTESNRTDPLRSDPRSRKIEEIGPRSGPGLDRRTDGPDRWTDLDDAARSCQ